MDILADLLEGKTGDFTGILTDSGFSPEEVARFLPEAGETVINALRGENISNLLEGGADNVISILLAKIDITSLASKVSMDNALVATGLITFIPRFAEHIAMRGGKLGLIVGGRISNLADTFKAVGCRLFG